METSYHLSIAPRQVIGFRPLAPQPGAARSGSPGYQTLTPSVGRSVCTFIVSYLHQLHFLILKPNNGTFLCPSRNPTEAGGAGTEAIPTTRWRGGALHLSGSEPSLLNFKALADVAAFAPRRKVCTLFPFEFPRQTQSQLNGDYAAAPQQPGQEQPAGICFALLCKSAAWRRQQGSQAECVPR